MEIGLLGATGPAGRAMALRLAAVGIDVVVGSRSADRAAEAVAQLLERHPDRDLSIRSGDNAEAAVCELVIIATPWDVAPEVASTVAGHLGRKVVVCMSNALARVAGEFQPLVPPRGSVSANVQAMVPDAYVAAAMHHVPATELAAIDEEVQSDVLICSDHPWAIETVSRLVERIPGARPLDAGRLSNATAIEALASGVMADITVSLPDGSARTLAAGATAADLAADIGAGLARDAIAAVVDGEERDLVVGLPEGATVEIVTPGSDRGLETLRHSTAHVLAQAVLGLWPGSTFAIGPPIENGFYYDFELPDGATFGPEDLEAIDARMREIIASSGWRPARPTASWSTRPTPVAP